jgi:hypothetical protein
MANYKQIQNLFDNYFQGKMDPAEQVEFEIQLHNDPLMQGEFELQKDIVNAIQESRRQDIKARLDQIKVGGTQPFNFVNIAASVTLATIVSVGSYLYFSNKADNDITKIDLTSSVKQTYQLDDTMPSIPEAMVDRNETEEILAIEQTPQVTTRTEAEVMEPVAVIVPNIEMPTVPENFEDVNSLEIEDDLANNTQGFDNIRNSEVPSFEIENKFKEDLFHYQFYDGKLYLYGDFKNTPYNIIELKSDNKRRVFLNHLNTYYLLSLSQKEMAPLVEIKDSTLIKELEILKNEE